MASLILLSSYPFRIYSSTSRCQSVYVKAPSFGESQNRDRTTLTLPHSPSFLALVGRHPRLSLRFCWLHLWVRLAVVILLVQSVSLPLDLNVVSEPIDTSSSSPSTSSLSSLGSVSSVSYSDSEGSRAEW